MLQRFSILAALCAVSFFALTAHASTESVVEADRVRIQKHLAKVEAKLRAKDVSQLPPKLQKAREANLDVLHEYRLAGEFPHNTLTSEQTPIFIDPDDRACAVAHLMIESGWEAEARAISERENLKRLPDMKSPEVAAWLKTSGLTAEEATLIQPSYNACNDECSCEADPVCGNDGLTYVNECFARNCGGVSAVKPGCCKVEDEIESSWSGDYGALGTICDEDPNERAAELCPEAVDVPDAGSTGGGEDVGTSDDGGSSDDDGGTSDDDGGTSDDDGGSGDDGASDDKTEPRACQMAPGRAATGGGWILMVVALVFGFRRIR